MNIGLYLLSISEEACNKYIFDVIDENKNRRTHNSYTFYTNFISFEFWYKKLLMLNFPKIPDELVENCFYLWLFGRNLELFFGSRVILGMFICNAIIYDMFIVKSKFDTFKNKHQDINPYACSFSLSLPLLLNMSPIYNFKNLRIISWGILLYALFLPLKLHYYETFPAFLSAFIMSFLIRSRL